MTEVLLINPPSPDGSIIIRDMNRSGRTSKERIIWPQTNMAYLAAMLPKGISVKIIDCIAEEINWKKLAGILKKEKPKYLLAHVITSTSTNDFRTFTLAKGLCNAKTISLGPHVTELTEESFQKCPELDYILRGEPEPTFKELIEALELQATSHKQQALNGIKGLAYRQKGKITINKPRAFIKNLDELPIPRHDLLPIKKYTFPFIASKFTFVVTSRGCPYPCTFCRQPIMWSRKVRNRSAENIMKELRFLKKMGVNNVIFHSDTFTIKKDVVIELCKLMVKEKLNMKWGCNSRVDTVDEEMLLWMKKAGCWMIAYGVESGSQEILDNAEKKATVEQAEKTLKLTAKTGIRNYGYFIIGLPGETKQTIRQTINFAKKMPITFAIFHTAAPYPGTKFYRQCIENNWLTNKRWEEINQGDRPAMSYPQLSDKEMLKGIKRAYLEFYLRPQQIARIMKEIRNINDVKHLFKIGLSHLKW